MTLLKPTITYQLADLLALAADMKAGHEAKTAALSGKAGDEITFGYHQTMVGGCDRIITILKGFRDAGADKVTAEFLIAEGGGQPVFQNEDTSLGGQLHKGQIRPVVAYFPS